jgi:hypothetical protein
MELAIEPVESKEPRIRPLSDAELDVVAGGGFGGIPWWMGFGGSGSSSPSSARGSSGSW